MSDRNTDPELEDFFRRVPPPEPSARLRRAVVTDRTSASASRRFTYRGSQVGLAFAGLAASVVLSAGLLFVTFNHATPGNLGPGESSSASPSIPASETAASSPDGSPLPVITDVPNPTSVATPGPTLDPSFTFGPAGTFKLVATVAISQPQAVALSDGRVLLVGWQQIQIFDPATNKLGPITSLKIALARGSATALPDGTVLIAGGIDDTVGQPVSSAYLYDPAKGRVAAVGNMIHARFDQRAVALKDGRVLIFGGYDGSAGQWPLTSGEIYDPATLKFSQTGPMVVSRSCPTPVVMRDGRVLIVGSDRLNTAPQPGTMITAEVFDPADGSFTATGSMSNGRECSAGALLPDGRVLIAGGDVLPPGGTAEVYDPQTGKFTETGKMAISRFSLAASNLADGRVLITGGINNTGAVASVNPAIFAMTDSGYLNIAELYDPYTGKFTKITHMLGRRYGHTSTLMADGRVLLVGGNLGSPAAEMYEP